ncbi:transcription factor Tfb2, partial [Aureobasidium melanogenum]
MSVASKRALEYLEGQPGIIFNRLYQQPSTALAIFRRMLPHLAKNLVMAMLFMPTPLAISDLETWVKPDVDSVRASAYSNNILGRLKILEETRNDQNRPAYQLNKAFRKSLRLALTGGGDHRSFGVPSSTPDKNEVTLDFLDTYARQQWEGILYYVVGSAGQGLGGAVNITAGTKELLESGGFVMTKGRNAYITRDGFSFLLQETNAQIWTLLIEYLKLSERLQMDSVDVLSFLFTLGSLELGVSYTTENLTPTQAHMLDDLSDFGIVYRRASDKSRYYPTRLATTLTSDSPALLNTSISATSLGVTPTGGNMVAPQETEKGYIIVETNYRIYAYTSSPLNISILSLFANLKTRFPNMLTATLTKSSIQQAIAAGITADQIITYLTTHAHPILRKSTPILPPTVVDQIRLWQLENERMKATPGYLIREVGTQEEYLRAVQHADTIGVLIWQNDSKGIFFVTKFDQMQQYFKAIARRRREDEGGAGDATPR